MRRDAAGDPGRVDRLRRAGLCAARWLRPRRRGVGFEFRFRAETERGRIWWDRAFCAGSTIAAFCEGLVPGGGALS